MPPQHKKWIIAGVVIVLGSIIILASEATGTSCFTKYGVMQHLQETKAKAKQAEKVSPNYGGDQRLVALLNVFGDAGLVGDFTAACRALDTIDEMSNSVISRR
jgi:hypothetical protein